MAGVVITSAGRRPAPGSGPRAGYPFAPSDGSRTTLSTGRSATMVGGIRLPYDAIYRTQPWVAVAVNKKAKALANLPLHTFIVRRDGARDRVRPGTVGLGRLASLIREPMPGWSEFQLKFHIEAELSIWGHYFGVLTDLDGTPIASAGGAPPSRLWSIPWTLVEEIEGVRRPVDGYRVTIGAKRYVFTPEEVVHLRHYGGSPLEPLRRTLAIEDAAQRETIAAFENANRIAGILVHPGRQLSLEEADKIRAEFDRVYGGVDRAYKTAVIGGSADWKPAMMSHAEAELIGVRQLTREEVVAALDVPPPMVGILDHATYSNVTEQRRMLYADSIAPDAVMIEEGLETQLIRRYADWRAGDLEFDFDAVLQASLPDRAEAYTKLIRVGFTIDEIRHLENMAELRTPMSTTPWIAQELMPVEEGAAEAWADVLSRRKASAPDDGAADVEDETIP